MQFQLLMTSWRRLNTLPLFQLSSRDLQSNTRKPARIPHHWQVPEEVPAWKPQADIDYETIITYAGGYDEMVIAKGQFRGKIEQENADRQKKIEQLQDFVARFGAGTRASQVPSRKRQIQRLTLTDLKRSNIERPFIQFQVKKPSSKQTLIIEGLTKRWPEVTVCERFRAVITKGEKIAIEARKCNAPQNA
jgi:ATPase subunit of ABC transporter with duplicated ATPase domains